MIGTAFQLTRIAIGGKCLFNIVKDTLRPPVKGDESPDPQYQQYVNEIARANGIAQSVLVRQVSEFPSKSMAFSKGTLFSGQPQICIPKDSPLSPSELKFASIHELGHLKNHHPFILGTILAANAALLMIPTVPIKIFCTTLGITALTFIPLYRFMERQADDFAFTHCSKNIIEKAFPKNQSSQKSSGWLGLFAKYVAVGNPEKRNKP